MKLIVAIIRPEQLSEVLEALFHAEVRGLTISRVQGHGGEMEHVENYRGTTVKMALAEKVRLEIGVSNHFVQPTVDAILGAARTGEVGDGKIMVLPIEKIYRIRTGEQDQDAVTPVPRRLNASLFRIVGIDTLRFSYVLAFSLMRSHVLDDGRDVEALIGGRPGGDQRSQGLYRSSDEHDACGVGFVAHIKGRRSHAIVRDALDLLINLEHRGACGADPDTGDGAGILVQMPDRFLRAGRAVRAAARRAPTAPGWCSCRTDASARGRAARRWSSASPPRRASSVLGWRPVPTNLRGHRPERRRGGAGLRAAVHRPASATLDGPTPAPVSSAAVRHPQAHRARGARAGAARRRPHGRSTSSACRRRRSSTRACSRRRRSRAMFPDLSDPALESALALVHQRFSTNTFPSWPLAHPYRFVAHNGEINTLRGNVNWMRAREGLLQSSVFGDDLRKVLPVIRPGGSDTATLRQRARVAGHGRALAAARRADDDPGAVGRQSRRWTRRCAPSTSTTRR